MEKLTDGRNEYGPISLRKAGVRRRPAVTPAVRVGVAWRTWIAGGHR